MLSEREKAKRQYQDLIEEAKLERRLYEVMKILALKDLWFLLVHCLNQKHMDQGPEYKRDWLFDKCRMVQEEPDGCLDLWAREHYKSTIITYGQTIQDVLNDPELTVGIFSFNRPIAKQFLNQIKREFTVNTLLYKMFPEILWKKPHIQAPKWSENEGIIVKRQSNPKEATIEAWGLIDGQPTSKHYQLIVYDDIVTEDVVRTPDMMKKTTKAWELSLNLTKEGGKFRCVGTIYHQADTYSTIRERQIWKERIFPGTEDGTLKGKPVLYTPEYMAFKRKGMSHYVFSCQILLDAKADSVIAFDQDWIGYWPARNYAGLNIYILVDPASSKKKRENDYTVFECVGLGADRNYYTIDMVRDRMNLTQKAELLMKWHRKYRPIDVGYEEYGMQADIEHIKYIQEEKNYRFDITPLGGSMGKDDRIERLIPVMEAGRWYLPQYCVHVNYEGEQEDLVQIFISRELHPWPYCLHDDMLDTKSRILDEKLGAEFPMLEMEDSYPGQETAEYEYDELAA